MLKVTNPLQFIQATKMKVSTKHVSSWKPSIKITSTRLRYPRPYFSNSLPAIKIFVSMGEMSKMCACLVFMLCEPLNTSIMALVVFRSAQVSMRFSCSKCQNFRLTASRYQDHNLHDLREMRKLRLRFPSFHLLVPIKFDVQEIIFSFMIFF